MLEPIEFIYCWALNEEVKWSSENADTLLRRIKDDDDKSLVIEFIEDSKPGNFIILKNGILISCVNKSFSSPSKSSQTD